MSKKSRIDKAHFKKIRELPCVKCLASDTVVAHIRKFTDGGMGIKPSPWFVLPLCFDCHHEQHQKGELTFYGDMKGVYRAIDLAKFLYDTDSMTGCNNLILTKRLGIF